MRQDHDLRALEAKIDQLIRSCARLAEENHLLREENACLVTERAALLEKNNQARSRIETMIARLKEMEEEA